MFTDLSRDTLSVPVHFRSLFHSSFLSSQNRRIAVPLCYLLHPSSGHKRPFRGLLAVTVICQKAAFSCPSDLRHHQKDTCTARLSRHSNRSFDPEMAAVSFSNFSIRANAPLLPLRSLQRRLRRLQVRGDKAVDHLLVRGA